MCIEQFRSFKVCRSTMTSLEELGFFVSLWIAILQDCEQQHCKIAAMETRTHDAEFLEYHLDHVEQVHGKTCPRDGHRQEQLMSKREHWKGNSEKVS